MLNVHTITFSQIRSLRGEALHAGDFKTVAVCDLALDGKIDADDYSVFSEREIRGVVSMTREQAYQVCVDTINSTRALDS